MFQFTHPGRGATRSFPERTLALWFQFTHPGRGATGHSIIVQMGDGAFQFTHPGRGATSIDNNRSKLTNVSIHAPREGCDWSHPRRL